MAVTLASFRAEFSEFNGAPDPLVQVKIDEAVLSTPETVWGAKADLGVKYLAAHLLAISPFARELQLVDQNGDSIYSKRRKKLERIVALGLNRVSC